MAKALAIVGEIVGIYASDPNPCEAKYSKPQNFGSPGFAEGGYIGTASGDPVPPWMGVSEFVVKDSTTKALDVLAQVGGVDVAGGGE